MTQKEINEFLADTKVYVNGKSKEIQEKLFSLGYTWGGNTMIVCYTDEPFLYIRKDKTIAHGNLMDSFMDNPKSEITAEQILSLELTEPSYRPFKNIEECLNTMLKHVPFGWLKSSKKDTELNHIGRIYDGKYGVVIIWSSTSISYQFSATELFKEFTFLDGTPFGIKEE